MLPNSTTITDNAAESLEGKILNNRWTVVKKIEPKPGGSGGFFSVSYIVEDDEGPAFLKAINFNAFFQMFQGRSIMEIMQEQSNAFQFEKALLHRCRNKKLSKVTKILDEGEEYIPGFSIPNVPYLVFEIAEGDIRSLIDFTARINYAWKLGSLHNVAVGLMQLHSVKIGHQDLKPSNVLLYENKAICKIADLGRSLCKDILAPHENDNFPGDINYAPPEFLYRERIADWETRVKVTDIYLFGSLVAFYFTGVNMTTYIMRNLPVQFYPSYWSGKYADVLPYIINAFRNAMVEIKNCIGDTDVTEDILKMIEYCCDPEYSRRGIRTKMNGYNYDFARIVTRLDLLYRKAKIKLL